MATLMDVAGGRDVVGHFSAKEIELIQSLVNDAIFRTGIPDSDEAVRYRGDLIMLQHDFLGDIE